MKNLNINLDLNQAYDQTVGRIVSKTNDIITSIMELIFGNIESAAEKSKLKRMLNLEEFQKTIENKANSIPSDHFKEPDIEIIGPALENSKYYYNEEELREMFANLITSNMDDRKSSSIHVSFSEIIKQMDGSDARILKMITNDSPSYKAIANFVTLLSDGGFVMQQPYFYLANGQENYMKSAASIANLERLGIISVHFDAHFTDKAIYEPFFETNLYINFENQFELHKKFNSTPDIKSFDIQKGYIKITPLGKNFINVCL